MNDPLPPMVYASQKLQCPACGKHDWCKVSPDGLSCRCRRLAEGAKKAYTESGPWLHVFRTQDQPRPTYVPAPKPVKESSGIDWHAEAMRYAANRPDVRGLAVSLGLPAEGLSSIALIGWREGRHGGVFTFPERDGEGTVIGLSTRAPTGEKRFVTGGNRGLTFTAGWDDATDDPLWVVEGPTDAAAMACAGLRTVARPSNIGGAAMLAKALAGVSEDRRVIVVGENDNRFNRAMGRWEWPGLTGCCTVARELAKAVPHPIFWAMPPDGHKDARAFLTSPNHGESPWVDRGNDLTYLTSVFPATTTAEEYKADLARADDEFLFEAESWEADFSLVIDRANSRNEGGDDLAALFR